MERVISFISGYFQHAWRYGAAKTASLTTLTQASWTLVFLRAGGCFLEHLIPLCGIIPSRQVATITFS